MDEDDVNDESTSLEETQYEYGVEEKIDDDNGVYAEMSREELVEEDGISVEEAAFMQGYEEAA